jgi:short-subunit dehydrogenase
VHKISLEGKTILLTGAARGLGYQLALAIDALGGCLLLVDRDAAGLHELSGSLASRHQAFACDLTRPDERRRLLEQLAPGEKIDMLINCAGVGSHSRLDQLTLDEIETVMQVNALAPLELITALSPLELVVNIGSVAGEMQLPSMSLYSASKSALHSFTRSLQLEGVPVLLVILGPLRGTDFIRSIRHPRTGQPVWYRNLDLDAKTAAHEIVHAIQSGKERLVLPRWYPWIFAVSAWLMPLAKKLGISRAIQRRA